MYVNLLTNPKALKPEALRALYEQIGDLAAKGDASVTTKAYQEAAGTYWVPIWEFPEIRGTNFAVLMIRILLFRIPY